MTQHNHNDDILKKLTDSWRQEVPYDPALPLRVMAACRTAPRINAMHGAVSWQAAGAIAASLLIGLYTGALTDQSTAVSPHIAVMQTYVMGQGGTW